MAKAATLTNLGGTSVKVYQDSVSSGAFTVRGLTLPSTLGQVKASLLLSRLHLNHRSQ